MIENGGRSSSLSFSERSMPSAWHSLPGPLQSCVSTSLPRRSDHGLDAGCRLDCADQHGRARRADESSGTNTCRRCDRCRHCRVDRTWRHFVASGRERLCEASSSGKVGFRLALCDRRHRQHADGNRADPGQRQSRRARKNAEAPGRRGGRRRSQQAAYVICFGLRRFLPSPGY